MSTIKPITITEEMYAYLSENYGGYCIQCHAEAYGVEPDARYYDCEACGEAAVFGVEELLIRGILRFPDEQTPK